MVKLCTQLDGTRSPASSAVCHKCNRKGYFKAQYFSKSVHSTTSERTVDTAFIGAVAESKNSLWQISISVGNKLVTFKMAQVTAVSERIYEELQLGPLKKQSKIFYGPSRQILNVRGQFSAKLRHGQRSVRQTIFIMRGLQQNLLGLPAITTLHLAWKVGETTMVDDIRQQFAKVFSGLGTLGEEYEIKQKDGAMPYSLYTPRNVAIPCKKKFVRSSKRMENCGMISKIPQPPLWCAGMVVVQKHSGEVRICVDLKPLNEGVLKELHPIPRVEDTLAQLGGATVFSKLGVNSGFWQISLAEQSRQYTTFITPFGRYCFNKFSFGISSAPELFQRQTGRLLENLPGVLCLMDDMIAFGSNRKEHDERLTATLR